MTGPCRTITTIIIAAINSGQRHAAEREREWADDLRSDEATRTYIRV